VETENYEAAFANFVPGILHRTDMPAIARIVAPRKIILAGTLDGGGKKLPISEVRKLYPDTGNIEIEAEDAWNVDRLGLL
jgi:hypothetical protein